MQPPTSGGWIEVRRCLVCGSSELAPVGERTDGIRVLKCATCHMGFVERYPEDLSVLYSDAYFKGHPGEASVGYAEYESMAAHSTRWAARAVSLVCGGGDVLDLGCANGDLLTHLAPGLGRFGIEPNAAMAERCRAAGIGIVGSDVGDPAILEPNRGRFAVVTAISVLEHLADIGRGLRHARAMLGLDGVLLFEVPILSDTIDSGVWFRSSLEHVYYPTQVGLQNLVSSALGRSLEGSEVAIEGYGPTYVGMVAMSDAAQPQVSHACEVLFRTPPDELTDPLEVSARFMLDVVHAARRTPAALRLLTRVDAGDLDPAIRGRLVEQWGADVAAKGALVDEAGMLRSMNAQLKGWVGELERARDHFRAQAENWEREAGALRSMNAELKGWVGELERARDHFRTQAENWEREARAHLEVKPPARS